MLKNILYTGVLKSGDTLSEIFPHLQIITPEMFSRAAQIMSDRTQHKNGTPLSTKGDALLTGLLYCAHCGTRMILSSSGGREREPRLRYQCHHRIRHPDECGNQATFTVHILDGMVEKAVMTMFENMKQVSASKVINDRYARETKQAKVKVEKLVAQVDEAQSEVETYKAEVGKCLRGTSKWDADLLRELLDEAQVKLSERQSQLDES